MPGNGKKKHHRLDKGSATRVECIPNSQWMRYFWVTLEAFFYSQFSMFFSGIQLFIFLDVRNFCVTITEPF